MINFKQEELIEALTERIREKFREVTLLNVSESWEDPETLWIHVTAPEDDGRMMELIEFAGDHTTDILMDYGYHMLVMPTRKKAAWPISENKAGERIRLKPQSPVFKGIAMARSGNEEYCVRAAPQIRQRMSGSHKCKLKSQAGICNPVRHGKDS